MSRFTYTSLLQVLNCWGHCLKEYPEIAPVMFTIGNISVTLSFRMQANHLVGSSEDDSAMNVKSKHRGWWVQTKRQYVALGVKTVLRSPPWKLMSLKTLVTHSLETEAKKIKYNTWCNEVILQILSVFAVVLGGVFAFFPIVLSFFYVSRYGTLLLKCLLVPLSFVMWHPVFA